MSPTHVSRLFLVAIGLCCPAAFADPIPPIVRVLPPPNGIEIPAADREAFTSSLAKLQEKLKTIDHPLKPDVTVLAKAVDYALRHGEFSDAKELPRATAVLKLAHERADQLAQAKSPWAGQRGLIVRGFTSRIDGSSQPYGLVVPEQLDLSRPVPLYVWLHGRGDKQTDLHFLFERMSRAGQISPPNAIVVHPFGRHCLGFKSAGETDVLEAVDHVRSQYKIDPDRIVLMGFSMGGAGAWHLGAHYVDRWVAISPGAGFTETARYQNLKPETQPPHERTLWGCYDVPDYVRNLFNVPVVAYSGEIDKQIQAARMMEQAYADHGEKLRHIIGPMTEHKYHPESLKQVLAEIDVAMRAGKNRQPDQVTVQTKTLRYNRVAWVELLGLGQHWSDSRVDAKRTDGGVQLTTKNVTAVRLHTPVKTVVIDGQEVAASVNGSAAGFAIRKRNGRWEPSSESTDELAKRPGLQGPIDDAFLDSFLVVTPSGKPRHPAIAAWVEFELEHLRTRWRGVFRGELPEKSDRDVTDADLRRNHLVLWGDPESNAVWKRIADKLPLRESNAGWKAAGKTFASATHVPVFVYPNPLQPDRYVVCNSGPTFREAHDKTNSQQNPKLPDWAILDVTVPPNANAAGNVVAGDFFDEAWRIK